MEAPPEVGDDVAGEVALEGLIEGVARLDDPVVVAAVVLPEAVADGARGEDGAERERRGAAAEEPWELPGELCERVEVREAGGGEEAEAAAEGAADQRRAEERGERAKGLQAGAAGARGGGLLDGGEAGVERRRGEGGEVRGLDLGDERRELGLGAGVGGAAELEDAGVAAGGAGDLLVDAGGELGFDALEGRLAVLLHLGGEAVHLEALDVLAVGGDLPRGVRAPEGAQLALDDVLGGVLGQDLGDVDRGRGEVLLERAEGALLPEVVLDLCAGGDEGLGASADLGDGEVAALAEAAQHLPGEQDGAEGSDGLAIEDERRAGERGEAGGGVAALVEQRASTALGVAQPRVEDQVEEAGEGPDLLRAGEQVLAALILGQVDARRGAARPRRVDRPRGERPRRRGDAGPVGPARCAEQRADDERPLPGAEDRAELREELGLQRQGQRRRRRRDAGLAEVGDHEHVAARAARVGWRGALDEARQVKQPPERLLGLRHHGPGLAGRGEDHRRGRGTSARPRAPGPLAAPGSRAAAGHGEGQHLAPEGAEAHEQRRVAGVLAQASVTAPARSGRRRTRRSPARGARRPACRPRSPRP